MLAILPIIFVDQYCRNKLFKIKADMNEAHIITNILWSNTLMEIGFSLKTGLPYIGRTHKSILLPYIPLQILQCDIIQANPN